MEELCAIYVRVSTDIQDYERQKSDLQNKAKEFKLTIPNDGIFEDKLSGFKNEDERIGLKNLKEYCVRNKVKKILIWEISRLARKQLTLLTLTEFFKNNGINIFFLSQQLWLLDERGLIDGQVSMYITVVGWYGEYERNLMFERFRSQKILNESLGKYNGGKIPFGYTLNKENYYTTNEKIIDSIKISEAKIVREVFDLYDDGLVCSKICRIARSKGYPKIVCNTHTLSRLLRNTTYIGFKETKLGKRTTPPIITLSKFNSVNEKVNTNKTKADKGNKHVYLLRGLIKCSFCNSYYVGKQTDDGYICPNNSGSNKSNKNSSCKGANISISNLDGILWERSKYWLRLWKADGFDDKIENINNQELKDQIVRYENLIQQTEKNRAKANFMYKNDGYTPDEYKKEISKAKKEKDDYLKEIAVLESQIDFNEKLNEEYKSLKNRTVRIDSITDRIQIKSILKSMIYDISFFKADLFKTVVFVNLKTPRITECIIYNSVSKKGNICRIFSPKYFKYDAELKGFYAIIDAESVTKYTSTKGLKELGVTNLPDYVLPNEFVEIANMNNFSELKMEDLIDYPIPDSSNSYFLTFDQMMEIPDIEGIIKTDQYLKLEYFKNLKRERFSRKKVIKN